MSEVCIKKAIISVYDKTGISEFTENLSNFGYEILSSGGTAEHLRNHGIQVQDISEYTGSPEILGGRVKTIHPKIAAGILSIRNNVEHERQLRELDIGPIDVVVVNLYPFLEHTGDKNKSHQDMVELIDIGGPTLIRSAAKNYSDVAVITSTEQYHWIQEEMEKNQGSFSQESRKKLAVQAFQLTSFYDGMIAEYFTGDTGFNNQLNDRLVLPLQRTSKLRYGENPHQKAGYYQINSGPEIDGFEQLHGIDLSYNNIMDVDAAHSIISDFERPSVAIIKHTNPCGIGSGKDLVAAYQKAMAADSVSAFGGIMSVNRSITVSLAEQLKSHFLEVLLAPEFEENALLLLQKKKKLRILKYHPKKNMDAKLCIRNSLNGFLIQEEDNIQLKDSEIRVVSKRQPSENEMESMAFAWRSVKHVKSNAIVFSKSDRLLGIGAGQMSRVDSVALAIQKTKNAGLSLLASVMASDAFFPFRDGVDTAAKAGVTAIIQPGGSIRDEEVIDAVNEHGMTMVFTGKRHFRH